MIIILVYLSIPLFISSLSNSHLYFLILHSFEVLDLYFDFVMQAFYPREAPFIESSSYFRSKALLHILAITIFTSLVINTFL